MIDVKELRIGSHVEVNGVRARVIELVEKQLNNQPWAMYAATIDGEYRTCGGFLQDAEPIPITPELLSELGFTRHLKSFSKDIKGPSECVTAEQNRDEWNVRTYLMHNYRGRITCRYLHEMEMLVYQTFHKELIEE